MLNRGNKLDIAGLRRYLKSIVKEFVEKPGKVRVKSDEQEFTITYHLSVHKDDLATIKQFKFLYRSLHHIINKVTKDNLDKGGSLDDQFGKTV